MNTVIVTNQKGWDALPPAYDIFTVIEIRSTEPIYISSVPTASRVVAWDSSSVVARGSSRVEAWDSSSVVARDSSRVEAWDSSSVVARDSSSVVARGYSRVEARDSSRVEARDSSRVEAWGQTTIHQRSRNAASVHGQVVCYVYTGAATPVTADDAIAIIVKQREGTQGWLEQEGVLQVDDSVVLFKRVSKDFLTQEKTRNETKWKVGTTLKHPNWNPAEQECGAGKYHACSRAYFCDEFRDIEGDVYVAISIPVSDLYTWENAQYAHKVAFRTGTVLYQVDRWGDKV